HNYGGAIGNCEFARYDGCYTLPDNIHDIGVNSFKLSMPGKQLPAVAVTLYTGKRCDGQWERWGINNVASDKIFQMPQLNSMDKKVYSFKVTEIPHSSAKGAAATPNFARPGSCVVQK
ncbi:hypothetical protein GGI12_006118, partial [Dipsacomyces acuminosporus]